MWPRYTAVVGDTFPSCDPSKNSATIASKTHREINGSGLALLNARYENMGRSFLHCLRKTQAMGEIYKQRGAHWSLLVEKQIPPTLKYRTAKM